MCDECDVLIWWEDDDDGPGHTEGHYVSCPFRLTPLQADAARQGTAEQLELLAAQLKHDG